MDELEKAIEAARDTRSSAMALDAILSAWDATRELRAAKEEFVEATLAWHGSESPIPMGVINRFNDAVRKMRELRKKPRYVVTPWKRGNVEEWNVHDSTLDGKPGSWKATFRERADAEAWAAAQEGKS